MTSVPLLPARVQLKTLPPFLKYLGLLYWLPSCCSATSMREANWPERVGEWLPDHPGCQCRVPKNTSAGRCKTQCGWPWEGHFWGAWRRQSHMPVHLFMAQRCGSRRKKKSTSRPLLSFRNGQLPTFRIGGNIYITRGNTAWIWQTELHSNYSSFASDPSFMFCGRKMMQQVVVFIAHLLYCYCCK